MQGRDWERRETPRWMRTTRVTAVWAAVVLTVVGLFTRPYFHHLRVTSNACGGALPDGALDALTPDGKRLRDETSDQVDEVGWYRCEVTLEDEDDGDNAGYALTMGAWTRRDDQDRKFMSIFKDRGFDRVAPLPGGLPGFIDDFSDINLLVPCPALGKDDDGRARHMLVQTGFGYRPHGLVRGVPYQVAVALAGAASDRLGCGAKPLKAPSKDAVLPDEGGVHDVGQVSWAETKGTACSWLTRAELPAGRDWDVRAEPAGASPVEYCAVEAPGRAGHDPDEDSTYVGFHAWYGDWGGRFLFDEYDGDPHPMTATARCGTETANFAVDTDESTPVSKTALHGLLERFVADRARRHGCSDLHFTY